MCLYEIGSDDCSHSRPLGTESLLAPLTRRFFQVGAA